MSADPADPALASLEIRAAGAGLLDEPLRVRARGGGPDEPVAWTARLRDDDGRIWKAAARRGEDLGVSWTPGKASTGTLAALQSLRPVSIDVRAETADGRAATRTVTRSVAGDGVRQRRWRDGLAAVLHLPAEPVPCATVLIDATASPEAAAVAALAGSLLASRGALVLVVTPSRATAAGRADTPTTAQDADAATDPAPTVPSRASAAAATAKAIAAATERLAAVPGSGEPVGLVARSPFDQAADREGPVEHTDPVTLPPCLPLREELAAISAADRAAAWDALLARLTARPRATH